MSTSGRAHAAGGADRALARIPAASSGHQCAGCRGARRPSAQPGGGAEWRGPRERRSFPDRRQAPGKPRRVVARVCARALRATLEAARHSADADHPATTGHEMLVVLVLAAISAVAIKLPACLASLRPARGVLRSQPQSVRAARTHWLLRLEAQARRESPASGCCWPSSARASWRMSTRSRRAAIPRC